MTKTNSDLKFLLKTFSWRKRISVALLIFIVWFGLNFFAFLRYYAASFGASSDNSLIEYLYSAFTSYIGFIIDPSKSFLLDEFEQGLSDNLSTRTFIFGFLLLVVHTLSNRQPLMGQDISSNFLLALPSDIFVDKSKVLVNEDLYNHVYNLAVPDIANSYLTSAFLDFSWLGLVIYPLAIYLIFNALIKLVLNNNSILINLFLLASLLRISFRSAEASTTSFFADIRQFLFVYLLVYFYQRLFPDRKI